MRSLGTILILSFALPLFACSDPVSSEEIQVSDADSAGSEWVTFGLPSKSDDPGCPRESILCWTVAESTIFRRVLRLEDDLLASREAPAKTAQELASTLALLGQKLEVEQHNELDALGHRAADLYTEDEALEWLDQIRTQVTAHLAEGYFAAHAVTLGQLSQAEGKFDAIEEVSPAGSEGDMTADMVESLRILKQSGAVGLANAYLLQYTGVLDIDYTVSTDRFPVLRAQGRSDLQST